MCPVLPMAALLDQGCTQGITSRQKPKGEKGKREKGKGKRCYNAKYTKRKGEQMKYNRAEEIRVMFCKLSDDELREVLRAIVLLDAEHKRTIGPNWIDNVSSPYTTPWDIRSVLIGTLRPDENGRLVSNE